MKKQNGFTLIELLVVVAIIAVLVSLLLPALSNARQMAKSVKCLSNLHSLGRACYLYTNESNGKLPAGWTPTTLQTLRWTYQFARMMDFKPTYSSPQASLGWNNYPEMSFCCPEATVDKEGAIYTYGVFYNSRAYAPTPFIYYTGDAGYNSFRNINKYDSTTLMASDAGGAGVYSRIQLTPSADISGNDIPDSFTWSGGVCEFFSFKFRHMNGRFANMVFFDGSARSVQFEEWEENLNMDSGGFLNVSDN